MEETQAKLRHATRIHPNSPALAIRSHNYKDASPLSGRPPLDHPSPRRRRRRPPGEAPRRTAAARLRAASSPACCVLSFSLRSKIPPRLLLPCLLGYGCRPSKCIGCPCSGPMAAGCGCWSLWTGR
ncbi:hypothetical protein VPH35_027702 [Triticum aestivum]